MNAERQRWRRQTEVAAEGLSVKIEQRLKAFNIATRLFLVVSHSAHETGAPSAEHYPQQRLRQNVTLTFWKQMRGKTTRQSGKSLDTDYEKNRNLQYVCHRLRNFPHRKLF